MGIQGDQAFDGFSAAEIRVLPLPAADREEQPGDRPANPSRMKDYRAELNVDRWRGFRSSTIHIDFDTLLETAGVDAYGQALGKMLFAADGLGPHYGQALAHGQGKMRIRLRLDPHELQSLHWERIYHPLNAHWSPLASNANTPFSRFVLAQRWEHPLPDSQLKVRMLAVIASSPNIEGYQLDPITQDERSALHQMLDALPGVELTYLESGTADPPTLLNLRRALSRGYHWVHFLCHGARTPRGSVLYLDRDNGGVEPVTQEILVEAFSAVAEQPSLTFLAACESAARARQDASVSLGQALIENGGVRAVVGMTDKVGMPTAKNFTSEFYARLLNHGIVDLAVNQARAVIRDKWDWGVPALFSRVADNCLIDRLREPPAGAVQPASAMAELVRRRHQQEDWGEARRGERLIGRAVESAELREWIETERCRLIGVYGLGGMGKTALATSVAKEVQNGFESVYWRSLQNEYEPVEYLRHCVQFILAQPPASLPDDFEGLLSIFIDGLKERRCLLILDNMETVLESGQRAGTYRKGYEHYGKLLQSVASVEHRSCVIVTSREEVVEVRAKAQGPVRALEVQALDAASARQVALSEEADLRGADEDWARLVEICGGVPLALKLVADYVSRLFGGDIAQFLAQSQVKIESVEDIVQQQVGRLHRLERQALIWFAIEREAITIDELREDFLALDRAADDDLLAAVMSLQRRSMVEARTAGRFSLQPVIMDFVTHMLVEEVSSEIGQEKLDAMATFALVKARSKDYVRDIQARLILLPIVERLRQVYGQEGAVRKIGRLLEALRQADPLVAPQVARGYAAANCLNLLLGLGADLSAANFAGAVIRQADLQNAVLHDLDFSRAVFESSLFRSNFTGVICMAFGPVGDILATGTSAGETWLWNIISTFPQAGSGQRDLTHSIDLVPLRVLRGHTDMVQGIAFTSDGALLTSGSEDGTVALWEVGTGRMRWQARAHANQVYAVAVSPDGTVIASGGDDCDVLIWDVASGTRVRTLAGHSDWLHSVAFNSDGTLLATASEDHTVRVWDVRGGQELHALSGHQAAVRWVRFARRGDLLASASTDQEARFWDARSGKPVARILGESGAGIGRVIFSPDGESAASFGDEHTTRLWNVRYGHALASLTSEYRINVADLSPDSRMLAFGGEDHTIQIWEVSTGQRLRVLHGYSDWHKAVTYSGDGHFFASCGDDKAIRLWDAATAACLQTFTGHAGHIRSVALNYDGTRLASCSDDGTIALWDPSSGSLVQTLRGHRDRVWDVAFTPDGKRLASASFDHTVRIWEVGTGLCIRTLEGHKSHVRSVAFGPGGALLASSGDDREVRLWDVESGKTLRTLGHHTDIVWDVNFSRDGRLCASASGDATINLWDASSGQLLDTLRGHEGSVWGIAFSPDDAWLASGGSDKTVRLWPIGHWSGGVLKRLGLIQLTRRLGTARAPLVLNGHIACVRSVAFRSNGQTLASCGHDGTIRLWTMDELHTSRMLRPDRPYERMSITQATGLTPAQRHALRALGAVEGSEAME